MQSFTGGLKNRGYFLYILHKCGRVEGGGKRIDHQRTYKKTRYTEKTYFSRICGPVYSRSSPDLSNLHKQPSQTASLVLNIEHAEDGCCETYRRRTGHATTSSSSEKGGGTSISLSPCSSSRRKPRDTLIHSRFDHTDARTSAPGPPYSATRPRD